MSLENVDIVIFGLINISGWSSTNVCLSVDVCYKLIFDHEYLVDSTMACKSVVFECRQF